MFDTYTQKVMPHYAQHVHSNEHRAPTDESIKILRELEQKARDNILLLVRSDSNNFKYTATVYSDNFQFTHRLRVQFALNGHPYDLDFELPDRYAARADDKKAILLRVRDMIAKEIASKISIEMLQAKTLVGTLI